MEHITWNNGYFTFFKWHSTMDAISGCFRAFVVTINTFFLFGFGHKPLLLSDNYSTKSGFLFKSIPFSEANLTRFKNFYEFIAKLTPNLYESGAKTWRKDCHTRE